MNLPHLPRPRARALVPIALTGAVLGLAAGAAAGAETFITSKNGIGAWSMTSGQATYAGAGSRRVLVLRDGNSGRRMVEINAGSGASARLSGHVRLLRTPLRVGGRRAIVALGNKRRAAHAGLIRTRSGMRWAIWASTGGKTRAIKLSRRGRGSGWQKADLRVSWKTGVVVLRIKGRKVASRRFGILRRTGAANASIGLGNGRGVIRRGLMQVRSATAHSAKARAPRPAPPAPSGPRGNAADFPYDPGTLFNRPIRSGAPTDPRSAAVVSNLRRNVANTKVAASVGGEVSPIYRASASDPFYTVRVGGSNVRFRVPRNAQVGGGSDYPVVILNESHPTFGRHVELRLWQGSINHSSRTISASGTGLFHYNNDGQRVGGRRASGLPFRGQGTGSALSIMAGMIRPEEIRRGVIRHAIRFSYSNTDFGNGFRAPATKSDQSGSGPMQMGMRLQLDRSVNCANRVVPGRANTSKTTRFLRIVCRALQDYGMIVMDGTSPGFMLLYMEHNATARWNNVIGSTHAGSYGFVFRDRTSPGDGLSRGANAGIPWNKMRVVAAGN